MSKKISIIIILLGCTCCFHLREVTNSYFTFSFLKHPHERFHSLGEFHAGTELACALRCNRYDSCEEAIFHRALKKCSLHRKRDSCLSGYNMEEKEEKSRIWKIWMKKIAILTDKGQEPLCTSNESSVEGQKYTTGESCREILERDSSSPGGIYTINTGNLTWRTRCKMRGFSACGDGVWELVMKVRNWEQLFHYDSPLWTSQASNKSVKEVGGIKLPSYWLRNFTRICVTMTFGPNAPTNYATMVVNYTAQSLYYVMNEDLKKTWPIDASIITTPPNIDKKCLVKGLNMPGLSPWVIKARIGIQSTEGSLKCPNLPYLVRGVGIGSRQRPRMSCGDIIISRNYSRPPPYLIQTFPALCRIYIQ